jgi:hypothetical protein
MAVIEQANRAAIARDSQLKIEQAEKNITDVLMSSDGKLSNLNLSALFGDLNEGLLDLEPDDRNTVIRRVQGFMHKRFFPRLREQYVVEANKRIASRGLKDNKGNFLTITSIDTASDNADVEEIRENVRIEYIRDQLQYAKESGDMTFVNRSVKGMNGLITYEMVETGVPQELMDAYTMFQLFRTGQINEDPAKVFGTDAFGQQLIRIFELAEALPASDPLQKRLISAYLQSRVSLVNPNNFLRDMTDTHRQQMLAYSIDLRQTFEAKGMDTSNGMQSLWLAGAFRNETSKNMASGMAPDEAMSNALEAVKASTVILNGSVLPSADFDNEQLDTATAGYIVDFLANGNQNVRLVWVGQNANNENLYALMANGQRYIPTPKTIVHRVTKQGEPVREDTYIFNPGALFTLPEVWNDITRGSIVVSGVAYARGRESMRQREIEKYRPERPFMIPK